MTTKPDPAAVAAALVNGKPLAFKQYPDGAMVIIAPTGQKFRFTPDQVEAITASLTPAPAKTPEKPEARAKKTANSAMPDPKPTSKRSSAKK